MNASKTARRRLLLCGLVIFFGLASFAVDDGNRIIRIVFTAAVFLLAVQVSVIPHEFGHALMARWVGIKPLAIVVGRLPWIIDRDLFGFRVRIGRYLGGGLTYLDSGPVAGDKWRRIAVIAAGPAINALIAALLYIWFRNSTHLHVLSQSTILSVCLANVFLFATSLWPHELHTAAGKRPSDGANIWRRLTQPPKDGDQVLFATHYLRAVFASQRGEAALAVQEAERAANYCRDPVHSIGLQIFHAAALSEVDRAEEACDMLHAVLADTSLDATSRAFAQDNLGWVLFLLDEPGKLGEAVVLVQSAVAVMPWQESFIITHACLLAVTAEPHDGHIENARALLASLEDFSLDRQCTAYATLARGLIEAACGNFAAAREMHARARSLGATAAPLRVLARRIADT